MAEAYGYQMALGSIFPMDVLFKGFGHPLAQYCLWKVMLGAVTTECLLGSACYWACLQMPVLSHSMCPLERD